VTFNSQGGTTPSPTSKTVTFDNSYGTLPTVTKTEGTFEYTFGGWHTTSAGSGTEITASSIVSIANNHTLFAK
jgi:hypothetical protein